MFCKLLFYLYLLSLFGLILKNAFSEDDRVENTLLWCHLILSYIQHLMFEGSAKSPYNTGNVYGRNIPNLVHGETVIILLYFKYQMQKSVVFIRCTHAVSRLLHC